METRKQFYCLTSHLFAVKKTRTLMNYSEVLLPGQPLNSGPLILTLIFSSECNHQLHGLYREQCRTVRYTTLNAW